MLPKKPPAYLWYASDALNSSGVDELSAAEECWYRRALDRSWIDEGIPADPEKAARRIGKKCSPKAAAMILERFFAPKPRDPLKRVNRRQEEERKKYDEKRKKCSEAGVKSGRKRRQVNRLETEHPSNGPSTDVEHDNRRRIEVKRSEEEFLPETSMTHGAQTRAVELRCGGLPVQVPEHFTEVVIDGLLKRQRLRTLPDHLGWDRLLRWAFSNGFKPNDVLECYDLLALQGWRTAAIGPKSLMNELPNLERLRNPPLKKRGNNGQQHLSEREKSAIRGRNIQDAAEALIAEGLRKREQQERLRRGLPGTGAETRPQVDLGIERPESYGG